MYLLGREYERYIKDIGGAVVSSENPNREIRNIRTALSIRQEDIGTLLSLRRETISRIENGSICPTFAFVRKFSELMALAKVIRDLEALNEIKMLGGDIDLSNLKLLLFRLNVSPDDLLLISQLSEKGYQKSRDKILKSSLF
ncbi:MAG: helix-turn-helix domain-containing protein [Candidatus Hydrothermarchaeaceae archaeon]